MGTGSARVLLAKLQEGVGGFNLNKTNDGRSVHPIINLKNRMNKFRVKSEVGVRVWERLRPKGRARKRKPPTVVEGLRVFDL